jgi:hypothetical protein
MSLTLFLSKALLRLKGTRGLSREEVAVGWELEQVDSSIAGGHYCCLRFDVAVLLSIVAPFRIGDGGERRSWDG